MTGIYEEEQRSLKTRKIVICGLVVVGIIFLTRWMIVDDNGVETTLKPKVSAVTSKEGISGTSNESDFASDGWRNSTEGRMGGIQSQIVAIEKNRKDDRAMLKEELKTLQMKSDAKFKEMAQLIAEANKTKRVKNYKETIKDSSSNLPTDVWGVDPNEFGGTDLGTSEPEPQLRYVRLGKSSKRSTARYDSEGTRKKSRNSDTNFAVKDLSDLDFDRPTARNRTNDDKSEKSRSNQTSEKEDLEPPHDVVKISAFSFVKVTPLLTTHCPIGASAVSSSGSLPPAPVLMIVRAEFQEPNGYSTDLGTVHLYAHCSATYVDSTFGEAYVSVKSLSMKDEVLGAQLTDAEGFVGMDETNSNVIKAKIRAVPKSAVLALGIADGLASAGRLLQQSEFTQGLDGGSPTQALTGNVTRAAAGALGTGAITSFQKKIESINASMFDAVPIKAGIPLTYYTTNEIEVKIPKQKVTDLEADSDRIL